MYVTFITFLLISTSCPPHSRDGAAPAIPTAASVDEQVVKYEIKLNF